MMVLRHVGPPAGPPTVTTSPSQDEDVKLSDEESSSAPIPMDLSNKHNTSASAFRITNKNNNNNNNNDVKTNNNNNSTANNNNNDIKTSNKELKYSSQWEGGDECSSPELVEDELRSEGGRRKGKTFIPLSYIRARFNTEQPKEHHLPRSGDKTLNKRARLEEMVTHIKQSTKGKDSGDEGSTSSSGPNEANISSDEVNDELPKDLRRSRSRNRRKPLYHKRATPNSASPLDSNPDWDTMEEGEKEKRKTLGETGDLVEDAAGKLCSMDPDAYQQQQQQLMQQLHLTSAAMMGDPGGLMKAMGSYPPWLYLGYYSQLLQSFQAQEILRHYAMQSQNVNQPNNLVSLHEKSPTVTKTSGSTAYNCQPSPLSPASLGECAGGMDSDVPLVGQMAQGNGIGKRAPRAMTGRHVRTGTGASPSTLQTLRQKIEERQRLKAEQLRHESFIQSHHSKVSSRHNANTSSNSSASLFNSLTNSQKNLKKHLKK